MFSRVLERLSNEGGSGGVGNTITTNVLLHDLNKRVQLQNEMIYQLLRVEKNMAVKGEVMADFNERLG